MELHLPTLQPKNVIYLPRANYEQIQIIMKRVKCNFIDRIEYLCIKVNRCTEKPIYDSRFEN